ncbi:hypothetical protein V8G54_000015 (mitochondrion) [Vigna mungo]|uniref:Uncharacterized protein n=1 Tax=Vigna mungo TaxID=3915 RepID=A0AAQ3PLG9_VIGMU
MKRTSASRKLRVVKCCSLMEVSAKDLKHATESGRELCILVEIHREISANSWKVLWVTGRNSQLEEEVPSACMKVGREGTKRSAKKENAEYLTMGETWRRCHCNYRNRIR